MFEKIEISELKRLDVSEAPFTVRKIWFCLIQAMERLDAVEKELYQLKEKEKNADISRY